MRRREFITLLGGAATWPIAAHAQQPAKVPRIGVLLVSGPEPLGPFREALRDLGYAEGKNIQIEVRSAQSQVTRLPELAAELVRSQVDVIVAIQTPAVYAAKNATRGIPIVMMAGDPIATGLISNLARPGSTCTTCGRRSCSPLSGSLIFAAVDSVIIVTKRSLIKNWTDEIKTHTFFEARSQPALILVHPVTGFQVASVHSIDVLEAIVFSCP
jgi:putative ABC transport system substrate-binding protein